MFTAITILMLLTLFILWKRFKVVHMREAAIKERLRNLKIEAAKERLAQVQAGRGNRNYQTRPSAKSSGCRNGVK